MRSKILLLVVAMALCGPAMSQKKKAKAAEVRPEAVKTESKVLLAPPVKVTTVEGITEYRLQNGLRVLLFPDQSNKPSR